ncbi:MAG: hypothetical protein RIQ81_2709 [Pseudomonadota bacterium]
MSQVVVTNDALSARRKESLRQEHKIDRESAFKQWRRNDITGRDPVAMAVGFLALPVAAFWSFVAGCITISFSVMLAVFRVLGRIFR